MNYDLEERTSVFGESIIDLCKKTKNNNISNPIVRQLIKCGTSIGANYCEANNAESKKDFRHKIGICRKESNESKLFLRMFARTNPELKDKIRKLWIEAKELNLIFNAIYRKTDIQNV